MIWSDGRTLTGFACLLFLFSTVGQSPGQTPRQIAQRSFPALVLLVMEDAQGQTISLGSGFLVGLQTIATNLHVIEDASGGFAKQVGQTERHDLLGTVAIDKNRDLALLAVKGVKASPLSLGDSTKVAVGDQVFALGNPRGLEGTFSQGIVSAVRQVGGDTLLQITAPISPGSSGGPVLNSKGEVIGVSVATYRGGQNLNFAIPSSYLSDLLKKAEEPQPLRKTVRTKGSTKSILEQFGGRSTDGVEGTHFRWTETHGMIGSYTSILGGYTFSLRNKLRQPVTNVFCLVVFYDRDRKVVDVDAVHFREVIPAGLARRAKGGVDGSVQELITPLDSPTPSEEAEFRILSFELVD